MDTQRRKDVKIEAEMGVMQIQECKDFWEPAGARKRQHKILF